MEKLYIPTTTLNFNNILSTESISPKSFYENRSFGYKRFSIVEPSKFENTLVAYSKIPYFNINDNELDNYPLIIEISKDIVKDLNRIGKVNDIEIFQISETIYLHPNKIRLLFFNEGYKKNALIKAEPSISTKLLPLYQDKVQILNKEDTFQWDKKYLEKIIERNINIEQHIYNDVLINKIKGFYFCYTLGEIYPILIIRNHINEILDDNRNKKQQAQIDGNYQIIYKVNEEENQYLAKIIKNSNIEIYKTLNLNKNKLTSFVNHNEISELYKNIINDIADFDRINNKEDFKINRFELLKKIGDNFKEINFDGKDKSIEYIRGLMRNIKNYEPFEVENINIKHYDILLKSIAYFILKGDDLEKLLNTLKEKNMKTFKMALGFWGALFGFSAIPKTISNILFEEKTKDFINIQDFLKDMYQKIHNFNIQDEIKIEFINKTLSNKPQIQKEISQKNKSSNKTQNLNYIPKCPKCGADMILIEPKSNDEWKAFYGCSKFKETGCKGSRDSHFKDNSLKVIKQQKKNYEIIEIYEDIKSNGGEMKLSYARKVVKIKTNKEFKDKYQNDNRFEFYKDKNTEMIRIK